MKYDAWVAKAAKQPIVLETVDFGPLGADEVEVLSRRAKVSSMKRGVSGRVTSSRARTLQRSGGLVVASTS